MIAQGDILVILYEVHHKKTSAIEKFNDCFSMK